MDLSEVSDNMERRHPWETAREIALRRILADVRLTGPVKVLDFGCGDAFTGVHVTQVWREVEMTSLDAHLGEADIQQLQERHPQVRFCKDLDQIEDEVFDIILLLDVLEHVEADRHLLRELVENHLAGGSYALITVPAFQALFSEHDRRLKHFRRYNLASLHALARHGGLQVQSSGFLFGSLLPVRALSVLSQRLLGLPSDEPQGVGGWTGGKRLTQLIEAALQWDNSVMLSLANSGWKLPGLSAWTLCQKTCCS